MPSHIFGAAVLLLAATATIAVPRAQQAPPASQGAAPQGGAAQGGAPQAPRPTTAYTVAGTLPARIMEFKVEPATIKPGESATLTWAVENPRSIAIEPTIGRAAARGVMKVTPTATTTYTLTVTGVDGTLTRAATVTIPGTQPVASTEPTPLPNTRPTPRTAEGKPDLSGVYGYGAAPGGRGVPPPVAGGVPRAPTLKPGAEKYRVVRGPTDTGLYSTCTPPGVPQTFMVPYYIQIVQAPKQVVILHEYLSLSRIILMDAQHPPDPDPFWMGHSIGRWEGDTLVVDSIGFKESEISGYKTTESLHLVERFRRPNLGTLEYEVVIEDPNVFAGPWLIGRNFPFLPEHNRVDEFHCENNRDYKPLFGNK
jgi:hypothetical protein